MGVAVGKVADPVLRARLRDGPFEVFERRPESRVVIVVDGGAGARSMIFFASTPCSAFRVIMMPRTPIPPRCRSVRPTLGKRRGISLRRLWIRISSPKDIRIRVPSPAPELQHAARNGREYSRDRAWDVPAWRVRAWHRGRVQGNFLLGHVERLPRLEGGARVRKANLLQVGGRAPGGDTGVALFSSRSAPRSKWSPCKCESRTKWSGDRSSTSIAGFVTHSEVSP